MSKALIEECEALRAEIIRLWQMICPHCDDGTSALYRNDDGAWCHRWPATDKLEARTLRCRVSESRKRTEIINEHQP